MNNLLNNLQGYVMGGYAGNHLMGISDTDVALGASAGRTTAAAILQFNKAAVAPAIVNMQPAQKGSVSVVFPTWSKLGLAAESSAGAEGADVAVSDLTSAATTVEILRQSITAQVPDLVTHGSSDNILAQAGLVLGNSVAARFDKKVADLLDNFATTAGAATTSMSWNDIMDAVGNLEKNDAPRPYSAMFHPLQVYGSQGLSNELGSIASDQGIGALNGTSVGEQLASAGFVASIGGVNIYTSPQVAGSSDHHTGAIMAKTAISVGYIDQGGGSFIQVESDRNVLGASTVLAANGYFEAIETVDLHGVTMNTETS
tara:strand:+ start:680 stop:1624 length:945 start_codon:yes stop_codon:yes gene_type:complete